MQKYILPLLLIPVALFGEFAAESLIVLTSLESEYPIEINGENRANLTADMELLEKSNLAVYHSKMLPWTLIIGFALIFMVYLIAKQQPKTVHINTESMERKRAKAQKLAIHKLSRINSINSIDAYYVEITNTVREYIEECYDLPATTNTTEEFLFKMSAHPVFDLNTQKLLTNFLNQSDKVKFAEHEPSSGEKAEIKQSAERFIKNHLHYS